MNQITNWINPQILKELTKLKKEFSAAKPFPHIHIKNFLNPAKAESLLEQVKKEDFIEKESDLFQFKQTHDLHFTKNKIIKEFHSTLCTWNFFNLIGEITKSRFKGTLDCSATHYESTDFLLCHDDELEGRKIAYLIYLSKDFTSEDGGSLLLYNSKKNHPTTVARKIPPLFNSLFLFEVSKKSFHEVEENLSKKSRYTLGGWLH